MYIIFFLNECSIIEPAHGILVLTTAWIGCDGGGLCVGDLDIANH